jgi:hypothetical protein
MKISKIKMSVLALTVAGTLSLAMSSSRSVMAYSGDDPVAAEQSEIFDAAQNQQDQQDQKRPGDHKGHHHGKPCPGGHLKIPHPWPGENPPGDRTVHSLVSLTSIPAQA